MAVPILVVKVVEVIVAGLVVKRVVAVVVLAVEVAAAALLPVGRTARETSEATVDVALVVPIDVVAETFVDFVMTSPSGCTA